MIVAGIKMFSGIMKEILTILSIVLLSQNLNSQIVFAEKTFAGVRVIKTKQFGGSGGNGYWNNKYLDKNGFVILEEKYKKEELLAAYSYRYDKIGNRISQTTVYDINNPNGEEENRISQYSYKYDNTGRVIEKQTMIEEYDSIEKINRQIDSLTYEILEINRRSYSNEIIIDIVLTIVEINDKSQITKRTTDENDSVGTNATQFIYFDNGELKRRIVTRSPKPKMKIVYTGWPGSDDMSWEYKFDKEGRIKKLYSIVNGRKTKLEEYRYEKW